MRQQPTSISPLKWWFFATLILSLIAFVANCFLGSLNQDEGWYLYAAQQLLKGQWPHLHYFFSQGSFMPMVYAAFAGAWSPFGVLGGRIFTALLAFSSLLIAGETLSNCCRLLRDRWLARLSLWAFLGLHLYQSYYTAIPKSYALCQLLLAAVLWLLSHYHPLHGISWKAAFWAGILIACLADIRISMGVLYPVIGAWLFVRRSWAGPRVWIAFGIGGLLGFLLLMGPEWVLCPEGFMAAQTFHAQRLSMGLLGRLGCLNHLCRLYPLHVIGTLLLLLLWLKHRSLFIKPGNRMPLLQLWLLCALALGALHLLAPVPYDDYQLPTFFLLTHCLVLGFVALRPTITAPLVRLLVLSACLITLMGSPIAENWFAIRQDLFWITLKDEPDLVKLRRVARLVETTVETHQWPRVLATQDLYLAVESHMTVPPKFEMGPFGFSYSDTAPKGMLKASELSNPATYGTAKIAALSGYTFLLDAPPMRDLRHLCPTKDLQAEACATLKTFFPQCLARVPDFGQQHTELLLMIQP